MTSADLGGGTRPREVHVEHVTVRKNALTSGRWTRQLDDALTQEEVRTLQAGRSTPSTVRATEDALVLQSVLNRFHAAEGEPPPELVAALVAASARLLEALNEGASQASVG